VESLDPLGGNPLQRGILRDLHETKLPDRAAGIGIESALLPNDGFHQGRVDAISATCRGDEVVVPMFQTMLPDDDQEDVDDDNSDQEDPADRFQRACPSRGCSQMASPKLGDQRDRRLASMRFVFMLLRP
jgi:hypothetical protein